MFKKLSKGEKADFNGILLEEEEFVKIQKEKEILDKIEKIVRKQNGAIMLEKNT